MSVSDGTDSVTQNVGIHELPPNRQPGNSVTIGNNSSPLTSGNDITQTFTLSQETANGIIGDPTGSTIVVYTDFQQQTNEFPCRSPSKS